MEYSPEQKRVIGHSGGSLLVSAAAGSGKTTTLVAHVMRRLAEHADLKRMIIVTYTRPAAGEMKARLADRLEKALDADPGNSWLRHQLALIDQAQISTVDSFCYSLVRTYFQKLDGVGPELRIAENAELALLKQDIAEEVLAEAYQAGEEDFYALLDAYSSEKDHDHITDYILALYESSQNAPIPEEWLKNAAGSFPDDPAETEKQLFLKERAEEIRRLLREVIRWQAALIRELEADKTEHADAVWQLRTENAELESLLRIPGYFSLRTAVGEFKPASKSSKAFKNDAMAEEIALRRGRVSGDTGYFALLKPIREQAKIPVEEDIRLMKLTEAPSRALIKLTETFSERFRAACQEKNLASFMDVEHYALSLLAEDYTDENGVRRLRKTELAEELSRNWDEIIVDEYQDINQVQDTILRAISGEPERPNLFMVGDVKQSIYRFRRADPRIFAEKYRVFSADPAAAHKRIDLMDNYRSRKAILDGANRLFEQCFSASFGGVDYDERAALRAGAAYEGPDPRPKVMILRAELPAAGKLKAESRLLAAEVKKLMESGLRVRDENTEGKTRPVSYRDIAVLCHTASMGALCAQALKAYGIPAVAQDNKGYYDTREVQTLLSLLAVLDNPRQDIALTAVLLSPFGGFTEEDLAEAAVLGRSLKADCLYERLCQQAEAPDSRFRHFLEKLRRWREQALILPVPELLDYLIRDSRYDLYLGAMPSGSVRLANIMMLKEMAAGYADSAYRGLFHFLRYVERQKRLKLDVGEAPLLSDGTDVVRIGTIHSSKGLEYPVVFLFGTGKSFNMSSSGGSLVIHDRLGIAMNSCDTENRRKCPNLWSRYVKDRVRLDDKAEELRLLYVAMTRAKEQLVVIGSAGPIKTDEKPALPREEAVRQADCFLDWFLLCREAGDDLGFEWSEWTPEDIPQPEALHRKAQIERWEREEEDAGAREELRRRLNYRYPYTAPPKLSYSVSALKEAPEPAPEDGAANDPASSLPGSGGAARGTAYHRLMELLPPEEAKSTESVRKILSELSASGHFTAEEAAMIDPARVAAFFAQPVGLRALKAAAQKKLRREQPFVLGLPYEAIEADSGISERVLVQGIIDMYFEEDGKLILIDYKTDRVRSEEELRDRYAGQLGYYRQALEAARSMPVSEVYIYSFTLGRFLAV